MELNNIEYTGTYAVAQIQANLYIIPRLHKEGYFIGITMPKDRLTGKEISLLVQAANKRMEELRSILYGDWYRYQLSDLGRSPVPTPIYSPFWPGDYLWLPLHWYSVFDEQVDA